MTNETPHAMASYMAKILRDKIAQIETMQRTPAGQDKILWFTMAELAADPESGITCSALYAPALGQGPIPTIRNGNGEAARPRTRMVALSVELVRAQSTLDMLIQEHGPLD